MEDPAHPAYPVGLEDYDLLRGDPEEQATARQRTPGVLLPESDPVYGAQRPLLKHWTQG